MQKEPNQQEPKQLTKTTTNSKLHQSILPSVDINEGPVGRDDDRDGEAERGHPDPHEDKD